MSNVGTFFDLNQEVSLSAGHDRMIVFARRTSGRLAHIDEVDNGKACGCFCLACNEALIARQGDVLAHSFAHPSGTQCDHALETMLHGVAVELIARRHHFVTPALRVEASVDGPYGPLSDVRQRAATQVPVDSVELAKRPPWTRTCIVVSVRGRELLVHIAVHRRAGEQRRETLAALDQAAVEIDLTQHFPHTVAELANILFTADARKSWLFNHREACLRAELEATLTTTANEQRRAQQAAIQARQAQWEREQAERIRLRAEVLAPEEEDEDEDEDEPPPAPRPKPPKPAELSANIEYQSREGRLWLLHSSRPEVYFKVEPGVDQPLEVLMRCGAVDDGSGVYRISGEGWSAASIELAGLWLAIRSVSDPTEPAP
jgi:hypothetical protein